MRFNNFQKRKVSDIYFPSSESSYYRKEEREKKKKKLDFHSPFKPKNLILIIFLFFLLGLNFYAFNPKIIINLTPFQAEFLIEETVSIDPNTKTINVDELVLPAKSLETELIESGLYSSSGEKLIEGKARGIIRVYNNYSTQPQILVAKTRFLSPEGKLFRTTKRIVVPGAKYENGKLVPNYTEVEVVAAEPGEEYNIGPTTFSIPGFAGTPKYTGFYGKSLNPMTGGFKKTVKIVTEEDIVKSKNDLKEKAFTKARRELEKQLPPSYKILEETIKQEVIEDLSVVQPGMESDSFTLKVKVKIKALAISINDLYDFSRKIVVKRLAEDREIVPDSLRVEYSVIELDKEKESVILKLEINGKSYQKIDEDEIFAKIQNRKISNLEEILYSEGQFQKIEIKKRPFWMRKVPLEQKHIFINTILD
jgi:hypothetical protein